MSLKEFSVRCSAITHVTAHAYGIVRAMGPRRPTHTRAANRSQRHAHVPGTRVLGAHVCRTA